MTTIHQLSELLSSYLCSIPGVVFVRSCFVASLSMANPSITTGWCSSQSPKPSAHRRTLSLQAFKRLIARQTNVINKYLSCQKRHGFCLPRDEIFPSLESLDRDSFVIPSPFWASERHRSIVTESDCTGEITHEDEGWIPIVWDTDSEPISPLTETGLDGVKSDDVYDDSDCTSLRSSSIFSDPITGRSNTSSALSSPVSAMFPHDQAFTKHHTTASHATDCAIEEALDWLFESGISQ